MKKTCPETQANSNLTYKGGAHTFYLYTLHHLFRVRFDSSRATGPRGSRLHNSRLANLIFENLLQLLSKV